MTAKKQMCPDCPDMPDAILKPAKVAGYMYCPRCGKGSIPVEKGSTPFVALPHDEEDKK